MHTITFITGNQNKADTLSRYLDFPIEHVKIDLEEIQSLDLEAIIEHKVRQEFEKIQKPVIVEDISLEFALFGGLPGPFIRFFIKEIGLDGLCQMLIGKEKKAIARCIYGYYDGERFELFRGKLEGHIADTPQGTGGFGWDSIFIPQWSDRTCAEIDENGYRRFSLELKPLEQLKAYLISLS